MALFSLKNPMEITENTTGHRAKASATTLPGVRSVPERLVLDDALQVAARLKLMLTSDRQFISVGGIKEEDGSSYLTASIGSALASLDQAPVLVVDANTRSSKLSSLFDVEEGPGLLDVLDEATDGDDVSRSAPLGNLQFLPLGKNSRSLAALLGGPHSTQVFNRMRQQYRYILVDCGTICDSPDTMLLASLSDGLVGAIAAAARRRNEVVSFKQTLEHLKIPLLGIVLTKGYGKK